MELGWSCRWNNASGVCSDTHSNSRFCDFDLCFDNCSTVTDACASNNNRRWFGVSSTSKSDSRIVDQTTRDYNRARCVATAR